MNIKKKENIILKENLSSIFINFDIDKSEINEANYKKFANVLMKGLLIFGAPYLTTAYNVDGIELKRALKEFGIGSNMSKDELFYKVREELKKLSGNSIISENVLDQLTIINSVREGRMGKFIVVDDQGNKLYIFNEDYSLYGEYPVITGKDIGDIDDYSFGEWMNKRDLMNRYKSGDIEAKNIFKAYLSDRMKYLKQITPSGVYTISKFKSKGDNDEDMKFYGKGLFSLSPGVDNIKSKVITIAIHGTHLKEREANLDKAMEYLVKNPGAKIKFIDDAPSYGCLNMKDEHLMLINRIYQQELANGNSFQVYIMSDYGDGVVQFENGSYENFLQFHDYMNQFINDKVGSISSYLRKLTGNTKSFKFDAEKFEIK